MKKNYAYLVALASLAIATSCSEENLQSGGAISNNSIAVHPTIGKVDSRAAETTTATLQSFKTYAFQSGDDKNYMEGVTYNNAGGEWTTSQGNFYWPVSGDLNFFSYAPEKPGETGEFSVTPTVQKLTGFTPFPSADTQQDFIYSKASGNLKSNGTSGVDINFSHALSEITVAAKNDNSAYTVEVSGVKIGNVTSKGDFTFPTLDGGDASWTLGSDKSDYTTEWATATTLGSKVSSFDASNTAFMLIPQQLEANDKAIDGNYIALKVKITMQGGQVVHDGWAYVAVPTLWEMGKHYTYTLDYSNGAGQDENGNEIISGTGIKFNVTVTPWDEEGIDINWNKYISGVTTSSYQYFSLNNENILIKDIVNGQWKYDVTNLTVSDFSIGYLLSSNTELNLSNLDVSGVTNLAEKFRHSGGGQIKSLNLAKWNTAKVTDMSAMFNYFASLETLDLSGWNTRNVTDMSRMFNECRDLESLDLTGLDVRSVTDMSNMFFNATSLTQLNIANWNTSNVKNMNGMFGYMKFTDLDLSKWDVSKVTNMNQMFLYCNKLNTLNLSNWDVRNVTDWQYMFSQCIAETIDLSGWKISDKQTPRYALANAQTDNLILKNWDWGNTTSLSNKMSQMNAVKSIDVSGWNTSNVNRMNEMFTWDTSLQSLDLTSWDVSNVTDMSAMFNHCSSLETLDLSGWKLNDNVDVRYMFSSCPKLSKIYMVGCNETTINKIKEAFNTSGHSTDIVRTTR